MTLQPLSPFPTLQTAPIESLGCLFFGQHLADEISDLDLIGTAVPIPTEGEPFVQAYFKVEAGGGVGLDEDGILFEYHLILHSYNADEVVGERIAGRATGLGGNALGWSAVANDKTWRVSGSRIVLLPHRQTDPDVPLPRYRSMVGWTLIGNPI